jgi:hypothetical protein
MPLVGHRPTVRPLPPTPVQRTFGAECRRWSGTEPPRTRCLSRRRPRCAQIGLQVLEDASVLLDLVAIMCSGLRRVPSRPKVAEARTPLSRLHRGRPLRRRGTDGRRHQRPHRDRIRCAGESRQVSKPVSRRHPGPVSVGSRATAGPLERERWRLLAASTWPADRPARAGPPSRRRGRRVGILTACVVEVCDPAAWRDDTTLIGCFSIALPPMPGGDDSHWCRSAAERTSPSGTPAGAKPVVSGVRRTLRCTRSAVAGQHARTRCFTGVGSHPRSAAEALTSTPEPEPAPRSVGSCADMIWTEQAFRPDSACRSRDDGLSQDQAQLCVICPDSLRRTPRCPVRCQLRQSPS